RWQPGLRRVAVLVPMGQIERQELHVLHARRLPPVIAEDDVQAVDRNGWHWGPSFAAIVRPAWQVPGHEGAASRPAVALSFAAVAKPRPTIAFMPRMRPKPHATPDDL